MKRIRRAAALVAGALILGLVGEAGAMDFSPSIDFTIGDNRAGYPTSLRVVVNQEQGEEELGYAEIRIPAGFALATDEQLQNGEQIGEGIILIHGGPRCSGQAPASVPAQAPVKIYEHARTSKDIADGAKAIYFVDLEPVTRIRLQVKGSVDRGWVLEGQIPGNAQTCPPLTFDATFYKHASRSSAAILTNPRYGGAYTFGARFTGQQGTTIQLQQNVNIDGPAAPRKKNGRKIKNKKKRRRCMRRQR